jgi:surfactin synthase thioesterase subunit
MTTPGDGRELWLRNYRPAPQAPVQLVCFPHAGGSASFYAPLARALAPAVDVVAVQYPGRQDRRREANVADLHDLAATVSAVLRPLADRPIALFGHSMGASLAFEVARLLEDRAGRAPERLFASGRRAPSRRGSSMVHLLPDEGLLADVRRLSGTDPRILGDDEMLRLALPAIRSDYRAAERYVMRPGAPLSCPITVLAATDDPSTGAEEAAAWSEHTTGRCEVQFYTGGHFFLTAHQESIARTVRDRLLAPAPLPSAP